VPAKYGVDEYIRRFATRAGIEPADVPATARTISGVLADHMSGGQLAQVFAELPADLRATIAGPATTVHASATPPAPQGSAEGRVARLEDQVASLTEALRALAHGLEDGQLAGVDERQVARAARLADEILIAAGSRS
jgi:hypothetical protein